MYLIEDGDFWSVTDNLNCLIRLKKVEEYDLDIPDCQAGEEFYNGQGSCNARVMKEASIPRCKEDEFINFAEVEMKNLWPEAKATAPQPCYTWLRRVGEEDLTNNGTTSTSTSTTPGGSTVSYMKSVEF